MLIFAAYPQFLQKFYNSNFFKISSKKIYDLHLNYKIAYFQ